MSEFNSSIYGACWPFGFRSRAGAIHKASNSSLKTSTLRRKLTALAAAVGLALSSAGSALAALDSKGTEFWLMFNSNYSNDPTLSLFITGDTATTGTVAIPGLTFSQNFSVTPGTVTTVLLPQNAIVTTADGTEDSGIHVTANSEVTVYGLNRIQFTTDAFLGLPTDILGTHYLILSYPFVFNGYGSEFGVVATEDNTTISIIPSVTAGSRTGGVPYNITLNQGEAYQLIHPGTGDLTGSDITSDKPVAVFSGGRCVNIPPGYGACDHIVEQLPPTSTWGQSFVTMPLATRLSGDTFRVLASTDNTSVSINGVLVATLNKGQFHEQIITGPATITASEPVLVAQYSNGSDWDGVTSDPFMMLIPPFEQFLGNYTVTTPASGFSANFINVVAPDAAVGNINLDGAPIPAASFTPIGTSGFSGAQVPVDLGSHNLVGTLPFGAFVYGFDSYDSYGYPGGQSLAEVAIVTDLDLTPETATNPVGTEHCVNGLATDQNSDPVPGVRVDFIVTGVNPNTGFANAGGNGVAQYCYIGANAGLDTIVGQIGALSDTVTKQWTTSQVCDVDSDGDIDKKDTDAILRARGQTAQPGDPRDADGDGSITVRDSKLCIQRCTRTNCAAQ